MTSTPAFCGAPASLVAAPGRLASVSRARTPRRPAPCMVAAPSRTASRPGDAAPVRTRKKSGRSTSTPQTLVLGLSHHTATVDVREKLAVPEAEWQSAARELCGLEQVDEAAILSTCNRFEVYIVTTAPFAAIQAIVAHLSARASLDVPALRRHLFMLVGDDAAWHLLRVSAGLDSLVVGEGQILSQVKKCYELAADKAGCAGKVLSRFLNTAVSAGKRVRSETNIAKGAVSISSAAVELAGARAVPDIAMPLEDARVAVVGAGKMARLLVQHLASRRVDNIAVLNRSRERAEELSKQFPDVGLRIEPLDSLLSEIAKADIVFTSTASETTILDREMLEKARAADKPPLMIIDISVPRNVAADAAQASGVYSYNVDDLKAVVAKNQARRRHLMLEAECVLREELATFNNWLNSLGCVPAISKLQQRAECIRQDEMERVKGKLAALSPSELKAVEALSKGIINKMLHSPMVHLRGLEDMEERTQTLRNIEALFKL